MGSHMFMHILQTYGIPQRTVHTLSTFYIECLPEDGRGRDRNM